MIAWYQINAEATLASVPIIKFSALSHDLVLDISDGKKCFLHQQKIVEHEKS